MAIINPDVVSHCTICGRVNGKHAFDCLNKKEVARFRRHDELVEHARKWLLKKGNSIVITEMSSGAGEEPDAIGFKSCNTTLIECKTTRRDFKKDELKRSRYTNGDGMGTFRYYLAPKGLINPAEIHALWGLLEIGEKNNVRRKKEALSSPIKNSGGEISLLASVVRRIGHTKIEGVNVRVYQNDGKNKATLSLKNEGTK